MINRKVLTVTTNGAEEFTVLQGLSLKLTGEGEGSLGGSGLIWIDFLGRGKFSIGTLVWLL